MCFQLRSHNNNNKSNNNNIDNKNKTRCREAHVNLHRQSCACCYCCFSMAYNLPDKINWAPKTTTPSVCVLIYKLICNLQTNCHERAQIFHDNYDYHLYHRHTITIINTHTNYNHNHDQWKRLLNATCRRYISYCTIAKMM